MNILLTGGGGYIGSILTSYLLDNNYKVTVIDSFVYDQNTLANYCLNQNLNIIKSDIRNISELKKNIDNFDLVIPLAGLVGAPACNFSSKDAESVNLSSNLELFKILNDKQKIIMPTTNSAYGTGKKGQVFDENSELKPISTYAKHKVEVEESLMKKNNFISLRLATVFGMSPRMRLDLLVNDFVYRACYDKFIVLFESKFIRNYIHVRDVCRAFIFCIQNFEKMKNNVYNVGLEDANLSKLELCKTIQKHTQFEIFEKDLLKDPDQRNYIVSNKKLLNTGFKTKFSIDDGIIELIKGYKALKINQFRNF